MLGDMSRPRLHYIEAFDHFEVLERWLPIFDELAGWRTVCHLKPEYVEKFCANFTNLDVTFTGPTRESWSTYLSNLPLSSNDLVILGTIGRRPDWFTALIGRVRYYIIPHNLNYIARRRSKRRLPRRPGEAVSWGKAIANQRKLAGLVEAATGFIYPSEAMLANGPRGPKNEDQRHVVIPFGWHDTLKVPGISPTNPLKLVVPGAVDARTKDYELLCNALTGAGGLELHLAGRTKSPNVVPHLRRSLPRHRVIDHPNGLSRLQYAATLRSADLLVAPLRRTVRASGYVEDIGLTKVSGSVYDAISFGKFMLTPTWYPILGDQFIRYVDSEQLRQQLTAFLKWGHPPVSIPKWYAYAEIKARWHGLLRPSG